MPTAINIDESPLNQVGTNDLALPASGDMVTSLNSFFGNTTWQSNFVQVARTTGFMSGLQNTIDLALTNSTGGNLNGVDSGINDLSGNDILLYTDTTNNNLVLGKVGTTVMFAIYLDATGSAAGSDSNATGADLWMVEFQPIQHNLNGLDPNDFVTISDKIFTTVTNPISFDATKAPSGSSLFVAFGDGTPLPSEVGVIATAVGAANQSVVGNISSGNVMKASQAGASLGGATFGVNSQHFDGPGGSGGANGDAAYFTFVKGLATDLTVPNLDQNEADVEANMGFTSLFGATKVSFVVSQMQGQTLTSFKISAMVAGVQSTGATSAISDDTPWTGVNYIDHQNENTLVDIDKVTIIRGASTWEFVEGQAKPAGAPALLNVDFTVDGGLSALVTGAAEGDKILYESNTEHDRLRIAATGNANPDLATAFDVGAIKIEAGGTSTAPLGDINIYDDGPSMSASATGAPTPTVDESNFAVDGTGSFAAQFTPGYGTDGAKAASPVTYALSTPGGNSGLVDTLTLQNVVLSLNGSGQIEGRTATSNDLVFVVSVDAAGVVTLNESRAVVHLANSGANQSTTLSAANLVVLTATAHDKDNDTAGASLNIGQLLTFNDDPPTITSQIQGGNVVFTVGATGVLQNSLNGSVGADAITNVNNLSQASVKQYTITSFTDGPNSAFPNLDGVLSADGTTVTYYSTNVTADQNASTALYQLTLSQSGAGQYTFTVLQSPPDTTVHFDFLDMPSGQNLQGTIAKDKANIDTHGTPGLGDDTLPDGGILVFPTNPQLNPDGTFTNASGTINTSKGGGDVTIGNGNQAFDNPGDGAWFYFVDNPLKADVGGYGSGEGGLDQGTADDADTIGFDGTLQSKDSSVTIVQASGSANKPGPSMHITCYEANPGHVDTNTESRNVVNDPTSAASNQGTAAPEVNIIGIKIHDSTGAVIEYRTNPETGASNTGTLVGPESPVTIEFVRDNNSDPLNPIYSAIIGNLSDDYTIEFLTETNHNLAKVEWVSGSFDIGGFDLTSRTNIPAQDFSFSAQITDYDNDVFGGQSTAIANWTVHVNEVVFV